MVARESIEQYRVASSQLSALVADELARYFGALDMSRPEAVRNALLEFVPLLVTEYGQAAAALAMEWYEQLRFESGVSGSFAAATVLASAITPERIEAKVRYAAGHLFDRTYEVEDEGRLIVVRAPANPAKALASLTGATDKYVKQHGRETVAWNAQREGARYARIPTGAKTCSFCLLLASRDAVYLSEKSAGSKKYGADNEFHGFCDCEILPIRSTDDYPPGYLPDEYEAMYLDAVGDNGPEVRAFLESLDPDDKHRQLKAAVFSMRRKYPDAVTDGVLPHTH
ncbi:VG15 protein [Arthrobacter sp. Z1-15]